MGNHDIRPTCLGDQPHDNAILDPVLHYLGCIEVSERTEFYHLDHKFWADEAKYETDRKVAALWQKVKKSNPDAVPTQDQLSQAKRDAENDVKKKMKEWVELCKAEERRIDYLRETLAGDPDESHLVEQVIESRSKWKASTRFKKGHLEVQKWRQSRKAERNPDQPAAASASLSPGSHYPRASGYNTSAQSLLHGGNGLPVGNLDVREEWSQASVSRGNRDLHDEDPAQATTAKTNHRGVYDPDKDVNAYIIEYETKQDEEDADEDFPAADQDQGRENAIAAWVLSKHKEDKLKVYDLLHVLPPRENPLHRDYHKDNIKYIHLPANNMVVRSTLSFRPFEI